ncbi:MULTISPECIES: hypothetical protein [Actinosynnema]|uniref:hypothetical protein n=1 Tax=Actinosynnema TaxID=40566 RepID=UPI0020A27E54|nr:hypothetical protein [Actinosynnema pretiosum]MCP2097472.1 hypothetical protein [Actinosynnema pretiosum]
MSAWVVSSGHIDVLVHALAQYGVVPSDLGAVRFRELGQALWSENHKSVNHRYREDTRTPRYELHTTEATLDPIVVLKAVACFEYQSCEHPSWPDSEAHDLMEALHIAVLERHPDLGERVKGPFGETYRYKTLPAWESAPWGIDVLEDVIPVPA